jgi:hypothetical protein
MRGPGRESPPASPTGRTVAVQPGPVPLPYLVPFPGSPKATLVGRTVPPRCIGSAAVPCENVFDSVGYGGWTRQRDAGVGGFGDVAVFAFRCGGDD